MVKTMSVIPIEVDIELLTRRSQYNLFWHSPLLPPMAVCFIILPGEMMEWAMKTNKAWTPIEKMFTKQNILMAVGTM